MATSTMGGDWSTDKYNTKFDSSGKEIGVEIDLRFKPKVPVDSKKIGLTQTVKAENEGKPNPVNEHKKGQMIKEGEEGAGTYVDQLKEFANPMYATGKTKGGGGGIIGGIVDTVKGALDMPLDKLAETPTHSQWGQHGYHYQDKSKVTMEQDALLKDSTARPKRGANACQIFETAAVSLEGAQKDTYYGTVQWGWQSDGGGAFTMLPLSIVSSGVPTSTFMKAAEIWNAGHSESGEKNIALPTSKHVSHAECFTLEGITQKIEELEAKSKKDKDPNIQFEIQYLKLERDKMVKVEKKESK